ncbi:hypothetical protein ISS04_03960 [Candidatus Woesearchaeota archaeon]|nr:hypothetical protein [Candidatus Woesearchaeota archaeon]
MRIEILKDKIKDLEYKLNHFSDQSIYFRWGIENNREKLKNFKKEYEVIKDKINSTTINSLEREIKQTKQEYDLVEGNGRYQSYRRNSLQNKINYFKDMVETKKKYEKIIF